jgi:hypothetical protein
MATNPSYPAQVRSTHATILDDDEGKRAEETEKRDEYADLIAWVVGKTDSWRTWRNTQYEMKWNQYERQWRGEWAAADRLRASERSRIVGPAISEAVENAAAEIEEATFGRGIDYFDVSPLNADKFGTEPMQQAMAGTMGPDPQAMAGGMPPELGVIGPEMGMPAPPPVVTERDKVETVRGALKEDLGLTDFAANTAMCILNSAVFGDGFAEIEVADRKLRETIEDAVMGGAAAKISERALAGLKPVHPRNMLYDPNATKLHDGLGCAVEENMPLHIILRAKKNGEYRKEAVCSVETSDQTLQGDQVTGSSRFEEDHVPTIRYYGLVPKKMLYPVKNDKDTVDLFGDDEKVSDSAEYEDGEYVEAIVVICNKKSALKVEANPYTMEDRPVVHFPWDRVPGRLSGRGICEKGLNSARILDAEIRSRLDSLAYVTAPMMGMDATRVPRGMKLTVQPGKTILTSGPPGEALFPFKFGQLDPNHFQNAAALQAMVQQATGSVDATALAAGIGDARSGAVSMALAPVIKRYKRTMVHFLDLFLMPALEKICNRNMQFNPERYPTVALKFKAASTMGIMQREYETSQMTGLLATMEPGTAPHRAVLLGIIGNSSVPNREEIMKMIRDEDARQAEGPDPEAQAAMQKAAELTMAKTEAEVRKIHAEAALAEEKVKAMPMQVQIDAMSVGSKGMYAVPEDQQQAEWDRRMEYIDRELEGAKLEEKAMDRESNENIVRAQMSQSAAEKERDRQHKERLEEKKLAAAAKKAAAAPKKAAK